MSLYIHQLKDLTPKAAEIESVFIIRDIKKQTPLPLTKKKIEDYFSLYLISKSELERMEEALDQLEPTVMAIRKVASLKDKDLEPINLKRAVDMLSDIPAPLTINVAYAKAIIDWQEKFTSGFAQLLNKIPHLTTQDERVKVNDELNSIFLKLLRKDHMAFTYIDLVNEAQVGRMKDLQDSMDQGFMFSITLEDELKHPSVADRRQKIPESKLKLVDEIYGRIKDIKAGVDAAYEMNVRMMNWALIIYAYIKLMTRKD